MCVKELILALKGDGNGWCRGGEPITKVINATPTDWNFQKPAWNVKEMSGNFILVAWWEF